MPSSPPHPAPSLEKLRRVYASERTRRPHWPRTFDAAMADPLVSRVLVILAQHVAIPHPGGGWPLPDDPMYQAARAQGPARGPGWAPAPAKPAAPTYTPTSTPKTAPAPAATPPRALDATLADDSEAQREGFMPSRPAPLTPSYHGRRQSSLDFKSRAAGERDDD